MTSRSEVYAAIDGERDYQDKRWNADTTTSEGQHTATEWVSYMEDYLAEAKHILSRNAEPKATQVALHNIRKVTAMGVACMEQLGAPTRALEEAIKVNARVLAAAGA